jgi:hypothetical protein
MLQLSMRAMLLFLFASTSVGADELLDASQALCEKVKACALEQMAQENFSAQERQQAQPALDDMCRSVKEQVAEVLTGHPQYANALACMHSMLGLSCAQMQDEAQMATPACVAYEKQVLEAESGL